MVAPVAWGSDNPPGMEHMQQQQPNEKPIYGNNNRGTESKTKFRLFPHLSFSILFWFKNILQADTSYGGPGLYLGACVVSTVNYLHKVV
jgi:hypothetical protein